MYIYIVYASQSYQTRQHRDSPKEPGICRSISGILPREIHLLVGAQPQQNSGWIVWNSRWMIWTRRILYLWIFANLQNHPYMVEMPFEMPLINGMDGFCTFFCSANLKNIIHLWLMFKNSWRWYCPRPWQIIWSYPTKKTGSPSNDLLFMARSLGGQ